ncbi:hypothetical protein vseg_006968 [Gypsophila vaccaria]
MINFEAILNPSFIISRILSLKFWKWGAYLVAFVYALNYVANKLKLLVLHYHHKSKSFLASAQPLLSSTFEDDYDDDDDDNDDDEDGTVETPELSDESEVEDEEEEEDFRVKGQKRKFRVPRRKKSLGDDFSLSDLVNGKGGIVKLWDGFGRGVESSFPSFVDVKKDLLGMSVWDFRCSGTEPVGRASWRSGRVGDVRMMSETTGLTEERWWDADGVSG